MILFELDGVLADIEHRRHFVEPYESKWISEEEYLGPEFRGQFGRHCLTKEGKVWDGKKDWHSYHAACVDDKPITPLISIFHDMHQCEKKVQIWTTRCESTREQTVDWMWLSSNVSLGFCSRFCVDKDLKMRPVGDTSPAWQLKKRWLNELVMQKFNQNVIDDINKQSFKSVVDFVFESDPDSIAMYRRRGIFVFDCNQGKS